MAQQNIPKQADPKTSQYANLLGVDYQSDTTEVSPLRSPEMVNMVSALGGIPVKRYGYRQFGDAYEGVATIGGQTWAVKRLAQGTTPETYKLYTCTIDVSGESVVEGSLLELSPRVNCGEVKHVFGFQNLLYVLCEKEWIERDTETGQTRYLGINAGNLYETSVDNGDTFIDLKMPNEKYIPTVYTMYKPNGKELVTLPQGVDLTGSTEGVNLLTPFRRVEYCVTTETATVTTFVIPNQSRIAARHDNTHEVPYMVEVLDSATYEWKPLTAGTDYDVNTSVTVECTLPDGTGDVYADTTVAKIEFASAPYTVVTESGVDYLRFKDDNTKDVPSGVPNVRVTYAAFTDVKTSGEPKAVERYPNLTATCESTAEGSRTVGQVQTVITVSNPKGTIAVGRFKIRMVMDSGHSMITDVGMMTFFAGVQETKTQTVRYKDTSDTYTATATFSYNGQNTITITLTNANFYYGGAGARAFCVQDEPQEYVLPFEPLAGTRILANDGSGGIFTAGTAETAYGYYYDGDRTIKVSAYPHHYNDGVKGAYAIRFTEQTFSTVSFYVDSALAPAYYKDRRVALLKSEAVTLFDARLFGGVGVHTYYSRASEPFKIDDNFYFDVDNDVLTYTRASRYLAIITEDIGRNTIFLASGEYDNTLAMMVYSVRASNAGVGAVSPYVSGTLNDEPLFLSRTGIFGISTNYLSEKYAISRSGKINKHLINEPNLERAVGISFNGYFYLAVNNKMYVLDGRHRDTSRNGDNSYECYYFDNMPNITDMFVVDNRLLFSDGAFTYAWNDDLAEEYQYIDNAEYNLELQRWEGEAVACKWTSKLDGDGAPHYYKTLSKKGTMITIAPPMQTSCEVTLIKDAHDEVYLGRFKGDTFALSDSVMDAFTKKKIKKYKRLQFVIENKEAEPFGLISVVKTFTLGNYAKR